MFFAQQCLEKRSMGLCEGPFFIAREELIGNFGDCDGGGHPHVALSGNGSHVEGPNRRFVRG